MAPVPPRTGALVLSLDFELAWGVRDTLGSDGPYRGHLLGARDEPCAKGVAFDIATDYQEMIVILDWKALVALLIQMPHAAGVVVRVVPHRMCPADPTHEPAHLPVDQRPQHEVVMVGH